MHMPARNGAFFKLFLAVGLLTALLSLGFGFTRSPVVRGSPEAQEHIPDIRPGAVGNLPDRTIRISDLIVTPGQLARQAQVAMTVHLTNIGKRMLTIQPGDFMLTAAGDIFGQMNAPTPPSAFQRTLSPGSSSAGRLTFQVPQAVVPWAYLFYRAGRESTGIVASLPLSSASTGSNTIEDTFTRANQAGWGTTTNTDGVPAVTWGMDGNGSKPFVTISSNTGVYGYPGTTNQIGIASASATAYNGGDSLVEFQLSAVGHATPYVVQNACADKSCYYGARLHTSQNTLELAKRVGNTTIILASIPFTPSANTLYWVRLDVAAAAAAPPYKPGSGLLAARNPVGC